SSAALSLRYRHSAVVTKVSVRQSSGLRCRPGIRTFAEQVSAESVLRLLPSLKPLPWQSLSAPTLQSGVPSAALGQADRPVTIEPGFASREIAAPASLARALRSSRVSLGLLIEGLILSISLPISSMRPGFSGAGCTCGGA